MIARLLVADDFDLGAKSTRFLCNDRSDAVDSGFLVRRRFRFDEMLQEGFCIHGLDLRTS